MGQKHNIVEINGKRYDAVTGALVHSAASHGPKTAAAVHSKVHHSSRRTGGAASSVDGIARTSRDLQHHTSKAPSHQAPAAHKPAAPHVAGASHAQPHKPQRAHTLMRTAVKKPQIKAASVIKAKPRTDLLAKVPAHTVPAKLSHASVDKSRFLRAERMAKSPKVSHFGDLDFRHPKALQSLGAPAAKQAKAPAGFDFVGTPAAPARPAPHHATAPVAQSRSSEIIEQALARATSHEQTFEPIRKPSLRRRKRAFGYIGASVVVLLLVGFFGLRSAPQISLKVASYRSGLQAKLPSYQPDNYKFEGLAYQPGSVTAKYSASSDGNGEISINQRASNWNSQALLSNVVATAKDNYQTYEQAGRTVYVIGNKTATWVDSGILYTVETNASLSSSQLLQLASSM